MKSSLWDLQLKSRAIIENNPSSIAENKYKRQSAINTSSITEKKNTRLLLDHTLFTFDLIQYPIWIQLDFGPAYHGNPSHRNSGKSKYSINSGSIALRPLQVVQKRVFNSKSEGFGGRCGGKFVTKKHNQIQFLFGTVQSGFQIPSEQKKKVSNYCKNRLFFTPTTSEGSLIGTRWLWDYSEASSWHPKNIGYPVDLKSIESSHRTSQMELLSWAGVASGLVSRGARLCFELSLQRFLRSLNFLKTFLR